MKFLPPAEFHLFEAHCLGISLMPTVWISVFTSVGCLEGSRATGSVFQLFRKPDAVGSRTRDAHTHTRRGGVYVCVVECKIELTFVKLGAAYYGMWQSM